MYGIATDVKAQCNLHFENDGVYWQKMYVRHRTSDVAQILKLMNSCLQDEAYIKNDVQIPETLFDECKTYYVYVLTGKRKKPCNVAIVQNTKENIDWDGNTWVEKKFSHPKRTIRLATCFSGIGAIEYAFKRLGLNSRIVFAGDIDNKCRTTYFANFDISDNQWHNDIYEFDATSYDGGVDILVGGAPCQSFSIVGGQRGLEDTRGTLFREFARVVKECQPKLFIFENVQGLLKHEKGSTWEVMKKTFEEYCGYDIHYQLLNARNYGIPQTRERLYCIGFKKKTAFKYPAPIDLKYRMYDFMEDYTDTHYFDSHTNTKYLSNDESHRKRLVEGEELERFNDFVFRTSEIEDKFYLSEKTAKYVLAGGTKNFKTSTKTDLDIARPLLQSMHKMHRAGIDNYVSYRSDKGINGLRKLTPRECFRLMGFRDDYIIPITNTTAYMQAGNSMVVDVLMALLKQLDITKFGIDEK